MGINKLGFFALAVISLAAIDNLAQVEPAQIEVCAVCRGELVNYPG